MTDKTNSNPMLPYLGRLVEVKDIATEIKLFRIEMLNGGAEAFHSYKPGQFAFVSAFGVGEAPFGIANIPKNGGDVLEFALNRLGSVETRLYGSGGGDMV